MGEGLSKNGRKVVAASILPFLPFLFLSKCVDITLINTFQRICLYQIRNSRGAMPRGLCDNPLV
jgi:hypothetical protein